MPTGKLSGRIGENTAVELLVEYRWNHDQEAFRKIIEDLREFADEDPEMQQSIFQEQCLWAVYDLDFAELGHLMTDWHTENCDPVWGDSEVCHPQ